MVVLSEKQAQICMRTRKKAIPTAVPANVTSGSDSSIAFLSDVNISDDNNRVKKLRGKWESQRIEGAHHNVLFANAKRGSRCCLFLFYCGLTKTPNGVSL